MRKKLLIFLGIFIFMIIPKNAYALTGSYPTSKAIAQWHPRNNDLSLIFDGSAFTGSSNSSLGNNSYTFTKQNIWTDTNGNIVYSIDMWKIYNSSGDMAISSSSMDNTFTFQWKITCSNTNNQTQNQTQRSECALYLYDIAVDTNYGTSVIGYDINNDLKRFWCSTDITDTQYVTYGTTQIPISYTVDVTCNTSNFKSIRNIEIRDNWQNITVNNAYNMNLTLSAFSYETSAYTGTQDGSGLEGDDNHGDDYTQDLENINSSIEELNQTMQDDNIDLQFQNSELNGLNGQLASNNVISNLLLLPVTLYQKILSSLNSNSCTPFTLGTLYGHQLSFPCVNISSYVGSAIWTTIDLICSGVFIFGIRKKFVDIFNNMTNLKDRGNEIE